MQYEKFKNIFKKIGLVTILVFGIVFLTFILTSLRNCKNRKSEIVIKQENVEQRAYIPPVIKLPFVKDRQPLPSEILPIPKNQVAKTIQISTTEPSLPAKVDIIISKRGDIYFPTNTSEEIKMVVTKWKPTLFEFKPNFGYSIGFTADGGYHCFSFSPVRIWKIYLGTDIGFAYGESKFFPFIGVSAKYHLATLIFNEDRGTGIKVLTGIGMELLKNRVYMTIGFQW